MLLTLLISLPLLACTDGGASRRAFLSSLVGQSETELVRQIGVPTRSYETGGRRFAAYEEHRESIVSGPFLGVGFGYFGRGGGFSYGAGLPADIVDYSCETTFEIDNGVVRNWTLRGNACS